MEKNKTGIRRPTQDDNEEDLLRFQEEFMKSSHKSSVKLVKKKNPEKKDSFLNNPEKDVIKMEVDGSERDIAFTNANARKRPRSKFKTDRNPKNIEKENIEEYMDQHDTHITSILSKIQERDVSHDVIRFPQPSSLPFPVAARNHGEFSNIINTNVAEKAPSIFAQQVKASPEHFGIPAPSEYAKMDHVEIPMQVFPNLEKTIDIKTLNTVFPEPGMVSGLGLLGNKSEQMESTSAHLESTQIHNESIEKLSQMTEQDILSEQQKLLKSMDSNLIKFIKSKQSPNKETSTDDSHPTKRAKTKDEEMLDKMKEVAMKKQSDNEEAEYLEFNLPVKAAKDWLNMKTVEWDKMQWLKDIPEKEKNNEVKFPHRFDFDGNLLNPKDELPTYMGLHHHGSEPNLPGYTLQELMTLSRSQFKQQRVLSVAILSQILTQDANGKYLEQFDESVSSILLDAGILFILRWSLDEQNPNLFAVAVEAFHALLVLPSADTMFEEAVFLDNRGCELPSLRPQNTLHKRDKDENDFEIARKDVIECVLRMNVIPRLRYILEVLDPSQNTKIKIMKILKRICLHSTQACVEMEKCQRLMEYITSSLMMIKQDEKAIVFPHFVSTLRYIATGGKHVAGRLLTTTLRDTILFYMKTTAFSCTKTDPYTLTQHEIWKLATTLCGYEYLKDVLRDILVNSVLSKLQTANEILYESADENVGEKFESVLLESCLILNFCAVAVYIKQGSDAFDAVMWSDIAVWVVSLLNQAVNIIQGDASYKNKSLLLVVSASLKFLTAYYKNMSVLVDIDRLELGEKVEGFAKNVLQSMIPLIKACANICSLQSFNSFKITKSIHSLPCFPYYYNDDDDVPMFHLLSAYLKCCVIICKINKACCNHISSIMQIMTNCDWLTENNSPLPPVACFFNRSKVFCCYWACRLAHVMSLQNLATEEQKTFYHSIALTTFTKFILSDEFYVNNVLSLHIFDGDFMKAKNEEVEKKFSKMSLNYLNNNQDEAINFTGYENIPTIRSLYFNLLKMDEKSMAVSRNRCLSVLSDIESYLLPPCDGGYIPCDWMFLPLLHEYEGAVNRPDTALPTKPESLLQIQRCLEFIYILQSSRSSVLKIIPNTAKIARILCVFLAGNDFFLDSTISCCISLLLREYCQNVNIEELDFGKDIPGIPFYDFYCALLDQFSGVSFGNVLFASAVLIPLHQHSSVRVKYCKALWIERKELIRIINITEDQLFIPKQYYFTPTEKDEELLIAYIRALASGACSTTSPFLYHIAVHHVSSYLFNQNEIEMKQGSTELKLFKMVKKISNQDVRKHILYYHGHHTSNFEFCETPQRNDLINNFNNVS